TGIQTLHDSTATTAKGHRHKLREDDAVSVFSLRPRGSQIRLSSYPVLGYVVDLKAF
ncbi:7159_t:CDS:2, partial [Racocetra persica]